MNDCGCDKTPSDEPSDYVLLKSTGKSASKCGTPGSLEEQSNCKKSDSTFDLLLAEFAFPDTDSLPIVVCNGALYSVNQWIQFVGVNAKMQIISITGNNLTVRAKCSNDAEVDGNPTAGTIIRKNTPIIVVDAPECLTEAQKKTKAEEALAQSTSVNLPNLIESVATEKLQVVGWVKEDSANPSFKKALKRITSFFFKNGKPFLENLNTANLTQVASLRPLAVDKNTKEVFSRLALSEDPSIQAGKKYVYGVTSGQESLLEGFIFSPITGELATMPGTFADSNSWVALANGATYVKSMDFNTTAINALNIQPDTFYAEIRIQATCFTPSGLNGTGFLDVDGDIILGLNSVSAGVAYETVVVKIPVLTATKTAQIRMSVSNNGPTRYFFRATLQGVYI